LYSGDAVHAIVGLMSVSAGAIVTDVCEHGLSFTEALQRTRATGLFEDDVFQDLEGIEAAQKLLLIARELGFHLDLDDVDVEPIARRRVVDWDQPGDAFLVEDRALAQRAREAATRHCTLRYVQRIECSPPVELGRRSTMAGRPRATVRLEEVPLSSPYAMVKGAVYYFAFHTARYSQTPLVIQVSHLVNKSALECIYNLIIRCMQQGPLSDSANTASGVVGDILRIAKSLGAKDKGNL
jgi:aspartokinase/homoserine dehydrogenase 1